mmetsp:Transcript_47109/g.86410  ORF Transcript_47109/g.86410 Transcript_47109/m.86410 type:complete len:486 (-) Transcript_47109:193-1650(-)
MPYGIDLDEWLAIIAPKYVVIKDRYLGFFKYGLICATILYVIIKPLIMDMRYLDLSPLSGYVEARLILPDDLTPVDELEYCHAGTNPEDDQQPCIRLPTDFITSGSGDNQIFITTSYHVQLNNITCMQTANTAAAMQACRGETVARFVPNIEEYKLALRHSVFAQVGDEIGDWKDYAISSSTVSAKLSDHLHKDRPTWDVTKEGGYDVMDLRNVLDLGNLLGDDGILEEHTRINGASLHLTVHYNHDRLGDIKDYEYRVSQLHDDALSFEAGYLPDSIVSRILAVAGANLGNPAEIDAQIEVRQGLRIVVQQQGLIGRASIFAFLVAIVSSVAVISAVNLATDLLLYYVLPLRNVYRMLQYEETIDFSEYRDGEEHAVAAMEHIKHEYDKRRGSKASFKAEKERRERLSVGEPGRSVSGATQPTTPGATSVAPTTPGGRFPETPGTPATGIHFEVLTLNEKVATLEKRLEEMNKSLDKTFPQSIV